MPVLRSILDGIQGLRVIFTHKCSRTVRYFLLYLWKANKFIFTLRNWILSYTCSVLTYRSLQNLSKTYKCCILESRGLVLAILFTLTPLLSCSFFVPKSLSQKSFSLSNTVDCIILSLSSVTTHRLQTHLTQSFSFLLTHWLFRFAQHINISIWYSKSSSHQPWKSIEELAKYLLRLIKVQLLYHLYCTCRDRPSTLETVHPLSSTNEPKNI